MTKFIAVFFPFFFPTGTFGQQNNIALKIDSLQFLKAQPFPCNSVYWRIVANGKDAIPFLIDKLDDTTATTTSLTCKKTNVKLGDICYESLTDIFSIPLFYVTHQQFDFFDNYGCLEGVLAYLDNNRQRFKAQIQAYYIKYKTDLKFVRYRKDYKDECKKENKILGYYAVDSKLLDNN